MYFILLGLIGIFCLIFGFGFGVHYAEKKIDPLRDQYKKSAEFQERCAREYDRMVKETENSHKEILDLVGRYNEQKLTVNQFNYLMGRTLISLFNNSRLNDDGIEIILEKANLSDQADKKQQI